MLDDLSFRDRIVMRVCAGACLVSLGLFYPGFRLTWASLSASSSPAAVDWTALESGEAADRHVELGEYVAYFAGAYEDKGMLIFPIGPWRAEEPLPTEEFAVKAAMSRCKVLARAPASTLMENHEYSWLGLAPCQPTMGGSGLIQGNAASVLTTDQRNGAKRRMGVADVREFLVIDLGKRPSLAVGVGTLTAGVAMFLLAAWFGLKTYAKYD